jgi:hypothetical protein
MVPLDMHGSILHPLHKLKDTHPELYASKMAKYDDREEVMRRFIPKLEALWGDVIHLTPIAPHELKQALVEAGMKPKIMKFYQVDPKILDPERTTIWLFQDAFNGDEMNPKNFAEFDPARLHEYASLSLQTKAYYKQTFAQGDRPLLYMGVPHILHKGSIDISNMPVITV